MPHVLFTPEIREMLALDDTVGLCSVCDTLHPATVAQALEADFEVAELWTILGTAELRTQAEIFAYLPETLRRELVEGGDPKNTVQIIEKMSHDDRMNLFRSLDVDHQQSLLRLMDETERRDMRMLSRYEDESVGALMTTDFAWLPATFRVAEAISHLRQQAPDRETIYTIYILAEPFRQADGSVAPRKLLGVVSLKDLILASSDTKVDELMNTDLVFVHHADDRQIAADRLAKYDFIALPVLDNEGRMLGIITHDDVIDVITQEATEGMHRQAGVNPIGDSYLEASLTRLWYSRALWLSILFMAQMVTINVMAHYDEELKLITALSFFVPLCLSVGGNAGSQAATLVTRALALNELRVSDWFRVLRRELVMGVSLAATLGLLALIRTWLLTPDRVLDPADPMNQLENLTWVIGISVTAICMWGTLLGSMLPLLFKKLGVDPAVTSSPFIATLSDVSGIIIYFNIARMFFFQ